MLPEQEQLIYQHFPELVKDCNLMKVMKSLSMKDATIDVINDINAEDDYRHNNRLILFNLLKSDSDTIFYEFTESLRDQHFDLAIKLDNKSTEKPLNDETDQIDQKSTVSTILKFLIVLFMKIFPTMM